MMTTGDLAEVLDRYTGETPLTINGCECIDILETLSEGCTCKSVDIRTKEKTAQADTQSGQTKQHR